MKSYKIRITKYAEEDLFDIYDYIARHDNIERAIYVLDKLESLIFTLQNNPSRGHVPPELVLIGVREFK